MNEPWARPAPRSNATGTGQDATPDFMTTRIAAASNLFHIQNGVSFFAASAM